MAEITLDLIGTQLERLFAELRDMRAEFGEMRADVVVLSSIANRQDSTMTGVLSELRSIRQQLQATRHRTEQRLDALERPTR